MEAPQKATVREHYEELTQTIEPNDLLPYLYQNKVIPNENRLDNITCEQTQSKRAYWLLRQISSSDNPNAIPIFIESLQRNGHEHLAQKVAGSWKVHSLPNDTCRRYNAGSMASLNHSQSSETELKQPFMPSGSSADVPGTSLRSCVDLTEVKARFSSSSEISNLSTQPGDDDDGLDTVDNGTCSPVISVHLMKSQDGYGISLISGTERPRHTGDEDYYITGFFPELQEQGICYQDTIVSMNGQTVRGLSKKQVSNLIERGRDLQLELCRYDEKK